MRKWIAYLCCMLPLSIGAQLPHKEKELESIDLQIQNLQKKLHSDELQEMKKEMEGQGLMIADWDAYAEEIQWIRKENEEEKKIREEIEALKKRKSLLLQKTT